MTDDTPTPAPEVVSPDQVISVIRDERGPTQAGAWPATDSTEASAFCGPLPGRRLFARMTLKMRSDDPFFSGSGGKTRPSGTARTEALAGG